MIVCILITLLHVNKSHENQQCVISSVNICQLPDLVCGSQSI